MPAYVVVQVEITDQAKYEAYKALTPAAVSKYGGRFIVRGGQAEDLEGRWDVPRLVILEFESVARAKEWYESPEYRHARQVRAGGANMIMTVVEGVNGAS